MKKIKKDGLNERKNKTNIKRYTKKVNIWRGTPELLRSLSPSFS